MGLINNKGGRTHWLEFLQKSEFSSDGSTLDTLTKGEPFTQVLAELREPARNLRHTETGNGGQPLLPFQPKEPGEEAVLKSQCEQVLEEEMLMGPMIQEGCNHCQTHEQVREGAGGNKCSHHSLHISSDFLLGHPQWLYQIESQKAEDTGSCHTQLGKSRAEKTDGEYRPVNQEGNGKKGLCWRRDAGRGLGSELR